MKINITVNFNLPMNSVKLTTLEAAEKKMLAYIGGGWF